VSCIAKCEKQAIGNKLDILTHEGPVHADEINRKGICDQ